MTPTREPVEAKEVESFELPPTRRLPRVVQPLPARWTETEHRTFRHAGPLALTIRVTADFRVAPFCVVPAEGYAFDLDDARQLSSDLTALLSWVSGREVEARRGGGGAA